jgi:hypothetical protein
LGAEHLDPGTPHSEWRRAIDAQMRKFGFARNSRHSRPHSSPSPRHLESPEFLGRGRLDRFSLEQLARFVAPVEGTIALDVSWGYCCSYVRGQARRQ